MSRRAAHALDVPSDWGELAQQVEEVTAALGDLRINGEPLVALPRGTNAMATGRFPLIDETPTLLSAAPVVPSSWSSRRMTVQTARRIHQPSRRFYRSAGWTRSTRLQRWKAYVRHPRSWLPYWKCSRRAPSTSPRWMFGVPPQHPHPPARRSGHVELPD
jgi:hypothetical protein